MEKLNILHKSGHIINDSVSESVIDAMLTPDTYQQKKQESASEEVQVVNVSDESIVIESMIPGRPTK